MERWEFLIQKEGDRVWTPINQSTWELEEGRYRIVAHSSQPNFEVELRITYQSHESRLAHSENSLRDRPLSQIQSCLRRTNAQGLMMILPFTHLEPGIWELRCYSDLMSELLGQGWQEQVQLQVLSKTKHDEYPVRELSNELQFDENHSVQSNFSTPINNVTETECELEKISNVQDKAAYYLQKLEQLLRHKIEPMLLGSEIEPIPISKADFPENGITHTQDYSQVALRFILNQYEFNRNEGEPILISGTVDIEGETVDNLPEFKGKLRYELQDPETEQIILSFEELIETPNFPLVFNYVLEIPSEWEMDFLIAEIILETEARVEIARQSLSITTDLTSQMSNPVNYTITLSDPEEKFSFAFDLLLDEQIVTSPINISLPQPSKMEKLHQSFQASEGQILPPKIARTLDNSKSSKTPQLPQIRSPKSIHIESVEIEDYKNNSQETAPLDHAFQSLEKKERFLERLSSLAGKANK